MPSQRVSPGIPAVRAAQAACSAGIDDREIVPRNIGAVRDAEPDHGRDGALALLRRLCVPTVAAAWVGCSARTTASGRASTQYRAAGITSSSISSCCACQDARGLWLQLAATWSRRRRSKPQLLQLLDHRDHAVLHQRGLRHRADACSALRMLSWVLPQALNEIDRDFSAIALSVLHRRSVLA